MAWNNQTTGAWKTPLPTSTKKNESSFPGLKTPEPADKIEYEELQQNEVLVLGAIYGEDFVLHVGDSGAWKKTEPCFDIKIKASSDDEVKVNVGFTLTASYPRSPPLTIIKDQSSLTKSTQSKIQRFLETQPQEFAKSEQEMIDKIVEGLREILEDAAQAKALGKTLPSLEEERELQEASLAQAAEAERQREEQRKLEESKEEERVISEMLKQQVERQKQKAKESRVSRRSNGMSLDISSPSAVPLGDVTEFDQLIETTDIDGNVMTFRSVAGRSSTQNGPVSTVYAVRPVLANGQGGQLFALKQAHVRSNGRDTKDFKKGLQSLESKLQEIKAGCYTKHRHLVEVFEYKVENGIASDPIALNAWTVSVLTALSDKGSLEELLEMAGHLDIGKVRSWTRDLLDALNFLHNKNISHQDIHAKNILLFRESTGEIVPKISDHYYQRDLHHLSSHKNSLPGISSAKSSYWLPPEIAAASKPQYTSKADIWDFGVVFVQMIFGLDVLRRYTSPKNLMETLTLSHSLQELVSRFFKEDKQKRPRAFELGSSEFLATDASVLFEDTSSQLSRTPSLTTANLMMPQRLRRDSSTRGVVSRYTEDFVEEGRLGKGGFGEVVKARKKLDGQIYAIKKITQRSHASLTEILKEVRLLAQLSHPAVVRYYTTWLEEVPDLADTETDTSTDDFTEEMSESNSNAIDIQFQTSTGGLDFMSSNANIEFGYDSESDDDQTEGEYEDDDDSGSDDAVGEGRAVSPERERAALLRRVRMQRAYKTILYISMEYCEKKTLRDLITRELYKNTQEVWRILRQILEGLVHIHGLSVVHRDLKPENIFISSNAGVDNIKIGDFGLATSGQFSVDRVSANTFETDDMTRSIGTAYYSAPEVRSASTTMYSTKVDMYSLGIIFFEMCYMPMMGMQKADVIGKLRHQKPIFPSDYKVEEKTQTEIILSLLSHAPKERPSSSELLKSGKLPVQMESETIRRTLAGLADPSSPYYTKMLQTLFARPVEPTKDYAWDMSTLTPSASELLNQGIVKRELTSIFRRHGALEISRNSIYPRSPHYGDNCVGLLDANGMVLQLPYDLTMGNARLMAKNTGSAVVQRTFTFGSVYRDKKDTGQPQMFGEVDYDIVTTDTLDLALKEAEVIKVLDEIILAFPSLTSLQMCFHVGHSDILQLIFDYCGIESASRRPAADILSKLNIHNHTWQKIKTELRSPAVGISATSADELQKFDFRDTPNKAFSKLKSLFEGTDYYQMAAPTIAHIKEVYEYTKRLGVSTKIYVNPLNSLKESFYTGGILFSCLYDKKVKDVFAAGGRYDSLIKEQRPNIGGKIDERHAVGFSLAWERLARVPKTGGKSFLKRSEDESSSHIFNSRRCDVLVASFDPAILRSAGIELLHTLWQYDISAEMAKDARSPEDLISKHRDENYSWIIIIKQDAILRIKNMARKDVADVDIPTTQLMGWLRNEIRERDSRTLAKARGHGAATSEASTSGVDKESEQVVKVLVSASRSKKFNRRTVVEQAQGSASSLLQSFLRGPILAVETTDQVMDLIRETCLSDNETWKKVEYAVTNTEKKYIREIHDQLSTWKFNWENTETGIRHAFVYNFRTGNCLYYDLGA